MIPPVLDVRTLSIILGIVILALGFCMVTYVTMRRTYPGFRDWTIATMMMGIGFFLWGMRNFILPYISIVIANGIIGASLALFYEGLRKYIGQTSRTMLHAGATFLITCVLMHIFSNTHSDVNIRIAVMSLIGAGYFLLFVQKANQFNQNNPEKLNSLLIAVSTAVVFLLLFRGVYFLIPSNALEHFFMDGKVHAAMMLSFIGSAIFFIFILIQMNSLKLENDLISIQELTQESEEEFRLLSEQAIMCIVVVQDEHFKYLNKATVTLSGYSEEELMAMSFDDMASLIHPDHREFVVDQGRRKMAGETNGVIENYVYRILNKNGEERWVQQYSKTVVWKGKPADFLTLIDITPQKTAEENLKKSEEKYRVLVENAMDAIHIAQDGVLKYCNPAIETMMGYTPEELYKIRFANVIHPDDRKMVMDRHERRSRGEILPSTYSFRYITKDGIIKWGQLSSARIQWEGKNATLNFLRDITRQKELEIQVQQAHKLEAIGTLSGGVAHEFNNLLSIILGNVEMAMDDVPKEEAAYDFLNEIKTATKRGEEIVRQLLSFSRPSLHQTKRVDIPLSIRETMGLLRASIPSSIVFNVDISPECHMVLGNSIQIRQVIINLCNNAAHAMEGLSGSLAVRAGNVTTKNEEIFYDQVLLPGNYVVIEVKDNGKGIAKEHLARIFDPFYTTKEVGKGSGMGLSVVQGIVKGHGGGIRITSSQGKGTLVQCYFPSAGKGKTTQPERRQPSPTGSERILFVDDELPIVHMIKGRLERLGYIVTALDSPRKALELYAANPENFDLVITDLTMPDITGDSLIAQLKEINPFVKTIICTGFNEKINALKAKEMGAGAFLNKPVERHIMANAIRQVMDSPA